MLQRPLNSSYLLLEDSSACATAMAQASAEVSHEDCTGLGRIGTAPDGIAEQLDAEDSCQLFSLTKPCTVVSKFVEPRSSGF